MIFAGPGSPTYAARQLAGSLAWDFVRARVGLGAGAVFASAAAIAVGRYALPVYEIYKAGHDLRWQPGLDLFDAFGLSAVFVPHWNNSEGGAELDTSRCFMGQERFAQLAALLPSDTNVFGVDEHTALVVDPTSGEGRVLGQGRVTVLHGRKEAVYADGARFDLRPLGFAPDANLFDSVPEQIAMEALAAQRAAAQRAEAQRATTDRPVPDEVLELAEARQVAREQRDWQNADRLRNEIESLGWQVQDTADGPKVLPVTAAR